MKMLLLLSRDQYQGQQLWQANDEKQNFCCLKSRIEKDVEIHCL